MEDTIDFFEQYETLPNEVKKIIDKFDEEQLFTYTTCADLQEELEKVGWTCDYGLSAEPYDLKPL